MVGELLVAVYGHVDYCFARRRPSRGGQAIHGGRGGEPKSRGVQGLRIQEVPGRARGTPEVGCVGDDRKNLTRSLSIQPHSKTADSSRE